MSGVTRSGDAVTVDGERYDALVLACHADQALAALADPSREEERLLGAWRYARNETVLHTDERLLPRAEGARASWNYLLDSCSTGAPHVTMTYDMNRLQRLDEPTRYCVTLNRTDLVNPSSSPRPDDLRASDLHDGFPCVPGGAPELSRLEKDVLLRGTPRLGVPRGWPGLGDPGCPRPRGGVVIAALYEGRVMHERTIGREQRLVHGVYWWLIDCRAPTGAAAHPPPVRADRVA